MFEGAADGGGCSRHGLCPSIAGRGRVAGAIKACFLPIGFFTLAAVAPAFAQAPQNGDELARMMITQGVLPWNVPENTRVADAQVCTNTVEISTSSAARPGLFFKPAQRSR